jgi:hypothetical protein
VLAPLAALALVACGAKTGLEIPDANVDMEIPVDAAVPPCIEVPWDPMSPVPVEVPVSTVLRLERADVLFLIDVTSSMNGEIAQIRNRLRDRIAPALRSEIPDVRLGVARFADFPVGRYGSERDEPFSLITPMTDDLNVVQAAMNGVRTTLGGDEPESQVEALYQSATGAGLGTFIPASFGCPMGGFGYPCFRQDSLSVIFLFTDAPFHNGPNREEPYAGISPPPHSYTQTLDVLLENDIRVLGFASGRAAARRVLERLATDTRATDRDGAPLVFDIGSDGQNLDTSVVRAIQDFAEGVLLDIDTVVLDPVPGDGVDSRSFVERVIPSRAEPASGVTSIDAENGTFLGVRSGTTVFFELLLRNDIVAPTNEPQEFFVDIQFRGNGRTLLERIRVRIVIPAINGDGCALPTN